MNYLSHFIYNHDVCGLLEEPYFAFAVTLPDLWVRYSRRRRIRWKAVRAATPSDPVDVQLRDGLLNHVAVDRRFHVLPAFLRWQLQTKRSVEANGTHVALVDFLAHAAIELALDRRLILNDTNVIDRYFANLQACDTRCVADRVGVLGAVRTDGLVGILDRFVQRQFLRQYTEPGMLSRVLHVVLSLADMPRPEPAVVDGIVRTAVQLADPDTIWDELVDGR